MSGETLTLNITADPRGITDVASVLGKLKKAVDRASDLQRTFGSLKVEMKALEVRSLELDNRVTKLTASFEKSKDATSALSDKKKKLESSVNKLSVANTKLLAGEEKLGAKETALLVASTKLAISSKKLAEENNRLSAANARLTSSTSRLSSEDQKRVSTNAKLISSNQKQISTNDSLIAANNKLAVSSDRTSSSTSSQNRTNKTLILSEGKLVSAVKAETSATKRVTSAKDRANKSTKMQIGLQKSLHSALRGSAGALGGLWLSYGRIIPMIAAFAEVSGAKAVLNSGSAFEFQMKFIETISGRTKEEIDKVSESLLEMAKKSVFAPNELAKGLRILAQAGIDPVVAGLETLNSVQDLAILGEVSMTEASTTLQTVMHAFDLTVADIPHAVDAIAKTSFIAATNVREMSAALVNSAQIGSRYGVTLSETNALLATLAKRHLVGAKAGTALTNMMRDFAPKSAAAADVYHKLNIEIYDSAGNMKPVIGLLGEMASAMEGYTEQAQASMLNTIQNKRGVKAMSAALAEANTTLLDSYLQILNSAGTADSAVKSLRETVSGDMNMIKSNIEDALIRSFQDSSVEIKKLSSELREAFASQTFRDFLSSVTAGTVQVIEFTRDHREEIVSLATAYVKLKVAMKIGSVVTAGVAALGRMKKAVVGVEAAILGLKLSNPIIFGIAAAFAAVAAKTLTTKDGLIHMKDATSDSVSMFGELVGIDVVGWLESMGDALPTLGGMLDGLNNKVALFIDSYRQLKIDGINAEIKRLTESGRRGLDTTGFGDVDPDHSSAKREIADLIEQKRKLLAEPSAIKKLSDTRRDRSAENLATTAIAAKKELESALSTLTELANRDSETQRLATLDKNQKLSEISQAQERLALDRHRKNLENINKRYDDKLMAATAARDKVIANKSASEEQRTQANQALIKAKNYINETRNAEITVLNYKKPAGTKTLDGTDYKKVYADRLSALSDSYDRENDLTSASFKFKNDLLSVSKGKDISTEVDYLKKQKALRDSARTAEVLAIKAQILKLSELGGSPNITGENKKNISGAIAGFRQRNQDLGNEQNSDDILTDRALAEAEYNQRVTSANTLSEIENSLLSDKESKIVKLIATYDARRESVDNLQEANIISVDQEIALVDKLDKAQEKSLIDLENESKKSSSNISEFWRKAYSNMQNVGASFFKSLREGSDSWLDSFREMTLNMVDQWLSAQMMMGLTGDAGSTGVLGGVLGAAGSFATSSGAEFFGNMDSDMMQGFGGWLDGLSSYAVGTDYVPQDMFAKIHKGEKIIPANQNKSGGSGPINITNNISVEGKGNTTQDRQSGADIANAIKASLREFLIDEQRSGGELNKQGLY